MRGTKTDGEKVDLWFRQTLGLARHADIWKIVHEHESVPFYMDGSYRAAVDLKPR
jgi:PhnB protein